MPKGYRKKILGVAVEPKKKTEVLTQNVPHRTGCSECGHQKDLHYEGPRGWCNDLGCTCQEHK